MVLPAMESASILGASPVGVLTPLPDGESVCSAKARFHESVSFSRSFDRMLISLRCIFSSARSTRRVGRRDVRLSVKICPKVLNSRSQEAELGHIENMCHANCVNSGSCANIEDGTSELEVVT